MKFSIKKWSKEFPNAENDGEWFFVKYPNGSIYFKQIRYDQNTKQLYLCDQCHGGLTLKSYGVYLNQFKMKLQFCGPIEMYPEY